MLQITAIVVVPVTNKLIAIRHVSRVPDSYEQTKFNVTLGASKAHYKYKIPHG